MQRQTRTQPEEPLLLTETEAAKILGFSIRTLQGWRHRGGGPRFVRVSRACIRYRRQDLETWIEDRLRVSTSDDGASRGFRSGVGI